MFYFTCNESKIYESFTFCNVTRKKLFFHDILFFLYVHLSLSLSLSHTHSLSLYLCLSLSPHLSLSLSNTQFQFQFKCALLAWQKLYFCIAKAIAAGLLTSSAHSLSLSHTLSHSLSLSLSLSPSLSRTVGNAHMCCLQWWESVDVMSSRACLLDGPRGPVASEFQDPKWGPCRDDERLWTDRISGKPALARSVLKKPDGRLGDGSGFMGGRQSKTTRLYIIWTAQQSSTILGCFSAGLFKKHILKGEVMWNFCF